MLKYIIVLIVMVFTIVILPLNGDERGEIKEISLKGYEPSGISVVDQTAFIVDDEGHLIKLNLSTEKKEILLKTDKDLEAITRDDENLYLLDESGEILVFSMSKLKVTNTFYIPIDYQVESISFIKKENDELFFYIAEQRKEMRNKNKSSRVSIIKIKDNNVSIKKEIIINIIDIADVFIKDDFIYLISDLTNKIVKLDLNMNILKEVKIKNIGVSQEGLFLTEDKLYLADDTGKVFILNNLFKK